MHRLLTLIPAVLFGCITVYSGTAPNAPAPQAGLPAPVAPSPEPPAGAPSAEDRLTIADTIQLCKAVQAAPDLPITCTVTYVEEKPAMFVGFGDLETANQYWGEMTEVVTKPFCNAANEGNRQALLFVGLANTEEGRIYSCESDEWSDWFSYSDESF